MDNHSYDCKKHLWYKTGLMNLTKRVKDCVQVKEEKLKMVRKMSYRHELQQVIEKLIRS